MSLSVCGENLGRVSLPKLREIFDVVIDCEKDKKHYAKKRILQNEKFWIASDLVEARMFGTVSGKPLHRVSNAFLNPEVRTVGGSGMVGILRNHRVVEKLVQHVEGELESSNDRNQSKSSRYVSKQTRF